ncbi:MAG: fructosamine kinase family protein [Anaerolineales bacterium]|nr:fructosamine kinase family protein [Anaerolineales bacterium]
MSNLAPKIGMFMNQRVTRLRPLHGGSVGEVYLAVLADGSRVVAKVDESAEPQLHIEADMLNYLAENSELPVPTVHFAYPALLIMDYVEGDSRFSPAAERQAAELLAALHSISAPQFGFEQDTLIGGLHQPNTPSDSWLDFFREQRLMFMGQEAHRKGWLSAALLGRLARFCAELERWLEEPARPSLIHGDVWTTNVLADGDKISAFIDPAIYYADPEIELAFTTLFGTFGEAFFGRYNEIRPLREGFFEERRDIYNLYPLLVHVCLFGGSYVHSVERILKRFGF